MKSQHLLYGLIGVNVVMFVCQVAGLDWRETAALWAYSHPNHRFWQWFTHLFLHADLLHLLFNMYGVAVFGLPLLQTWGTRRFVCLYAVSGLVGAVCYGAWETWQLQQLYGDLAQQYGVDSNTLQTMLWSGQVSLPLSTWQNINTYAIGASAAVFGILAAFSVRFAHARLGLLFLPVAFPAKYFVMVLVAYEVFAQISGFSLFGTNIAHLAHIGGALAGWGLTWWWQGRPRKATLTLIK